MSQKPEVGDTVLLSIECEVKVVSEYHGETWVSVEVPGEPMYYKCMRASSLVPKPPPAGFQRPFRWDGIAYFWDANNKMAADLHDDIEDRVRTRGWARIQYLDNSEDTFQEWDAWLQSRVDGCTDPIEIVRRLNVTQ